MASKYNKPIEDEGVAVTPENDPDSIGDDSPIVEAFDDAVKGVMEATEEAVEGDDLLAEHHYSDTFTVPIFGEMTLPGGIYTFILGVLAAATIIEVLAAELLGGAIIIKGIILLGLAFVKAMLVIAFYMHLNRDNWIFRFVIGVPFAITLISVLYLLGINPELY